MPRIEKLRDALTASPTLEYLNQMAASGWKLAALEWVRETSDESAPEAPDTRVEEVPYGLQVSGDGLHLVESPAEMRVLMTAVNMIVDDLPVSRVAEALNGLGYRTRRAEKWTPTAVFNLLPRMIEAGPRIFSKDEWVSLRKRLPAG